VSLCCALGGQTGRACEAHRGRGRGRSTRQSGVANGASIHDRRSGECVEAAVAPSAGLGRRDVDELYGLTLWSGLKSDVTLLGGAQPESILNVDIYRWLAGDLRANGRIAITDLTGAPLEAALRGGVAILKLSVAELLADGRAKIADLTGLLEAMWETEAVRWMACCFHAARFRRLPWLARGPAWDARAG
jgi:1-phosphofructokinase